MKSSLCLTAILTLLACATFGAVRPTVTSEKLPPIWEKVTAREKFAAIKVAQVMADRRITERLYDVYITSDTTVYDLMLDSDEVRAVCENYIKGIYTKGNPVYCEDGRVEVVRAVKLEELLEKIKETVKKTETKNGWVSATDIEKTITKSVREIEELGEGAIKDSPGMRRIRSHRAAQVVAMRELAAQVLGIQITSSTTVKEFALESDAIRARLAETLSGAKVRDIKYEAKDDSCILEMEIEVEAIFGVIKKYSKKSLDKEELLKYETELKSKSFVATGMGVPDKDDAEPVSSVGSGRKPFVESETIFTELLEVRIKR